MIDRRTLLSLTGAALSTPAIGSRNSAINKKSNVKLPQRIDRFAFGSCNYQWADQSYWNFVSATTPDLWLWLGDTIYSDRLPYLARKAQYIFQKNRQAYKSLCRHVPVIGTWDDHDFSHNDALGAELSYRKRMQKLFLDFLDEPDDSGIRSQEGLYRAIEIGRGNEKVAFIILDLRYFKTDNRSSKPTILGINQKNWLQKVFASLDAPLVFVGSSTQFLPTSQEKESWEDFPDERQFAIDLFSKYQKLGKGRVVILSGDKHFFEISKMQNLLEVTSSGLTHSKDKSSPNSKRIIGPVLKRNFASIDISRDQDDMPKNLTIRANSPIDGSVIEEFIWSI